MPDPAERPASFEEIIQHLAKKSGVSPMLALSVAEAESGFKPDAVSPKGARGLFQLMPATAQEMGVTNIDDPIENITGGLKYLSTLDKRYGGDVTKILGAYNAGPTAVDSGAALPAETQAYIGKVIAGLSKRQRSKVDVVSTPPVTPVAPSPEPPVPAGASPGIVARMASSFDPRRKEGSANVGATIGGTVGGIPGAVAGGLLGSGLHDVVSHATEIPGAIADVTRNLMAGGDVAAATKAGAKEGAQEGAWNAATTGATQAAYEVGGRVIAWPFVRFGRSLLATKVGKTASTALKSGLESATAGARSALETARGSARKLVDTATDKAGEALKSTSEAMDEFMQAAKAKASQRVATARGTARKLDTAAGVQSADVLAQTELEAADAVAQATKGYDTALAQPPDVAGVASATKNVLAGLPGGATKPGPAKRALDAVGKQIDEAAKTGPAIQSAPIKAALDQMAEKARPDSLFPSEASRTLQAMGFAGPNVAAQGQREAARAGLPSVAERSKAFELIKAQLPPGHPLPGILEKIQSAPEQLAFADAHQLKRLLDEAVSWDRTAKKHLEGLTKGIRTVLREKLAVHEPYNVATKAYGDLVPLYRKGAGASLIKAATERPDRIASLLKPAAPNDAANIRRLLVDQAADGGDELAGLKAWDHVRSTFTYNKVLAGGPEKLSERITQLETAHPEFVQTLYGDPSGQLILGNLKQIGQAFDQAVAAGAGNVATAKGAGKALKSEAAETGARVVENAQAAKAFETSTASKAKREAIRTRRVAGKQDVASAQRMGADQIRQARESGKTAVELAKQHLDDFNNSSMKPFADRPVPNVVADVARSTLGVRSIWGAISMMRLLRAPSGEDLLQAAAYSPEMTQRLVRVLNGSAPPAAVTALIRDLMSMTSGDETAAPPPAQVQDGLHLTIR